MGIWRIEIPPKNSPRMYGNANMYKILDADPYLSAEEVYRYWYERIEPSYLPYLEQAIEEMIQNGKTAEIEYLWNHPRDGKTVVRCDVVPSKAGEDGSFVMTGLHRDITNKLSNHFQPEGRLHIVDHYRMSRCGSYLIYAYEDVLLLDRQTKRLSLIAYREDHCQNLQDNVSILDIVKQCVFPEDQEKLFSLFSDETFREISTSKRSKSVDYRRGRYCGRPQWVRATLYAMPINGMEEMLLVIQNIENEYQLKFLREEKEDILYSLIREQSAIYEYDDESRQIKILKKAVENIKGSAASKTMSLTELTEQFCRCFAAPSEWEKVKTFLSYETLKSCMAEQCKKVLHIFLDYERFPYAWVKITLFPSVLSGKKAYILMASIDSQEQIYPLLESYIWNTSESFYYLDFKNDHFSQISGQNGDGVLSGEGECYTQEMRSCVDRFVAEKDRSLMEKQMSPEFILSVLESSGTLSLDVNTTGEQGDEKRKRLTYWPIDLFERRVLLQESDITEMYQTEQRLEKATHESVTDFLTQLNNRLGSERLIKKALSEMDRSKAAALIVLDLDNFKSVNDRFGHLEGDRILQEAAQKLKMLVRTEDIIGRLGGDEYLVFLPNVVNQAEIRTVLRRIVKEMYFTCVNERDRVVVTVSVGATIFRGGVEQSLEKLYREADVALYHAKKEKNRYVLYDDILKNV